MSDRMASHIVHVHLVPLFLAALTPYRRFQAPPTPHSLPTHSPGRLLYVTHYCSKAHENGQLEQECVTSIEARNPVKIIELCIEIEDLDGLCLCSLCSVRYYF